MTATPAPRCSEVPVPLRPHSALLAAFLAISVPLLAGQTAPPATPTPLVPPTDPTALLKQLESGAHERMSETDLRTYLSQVQPATLVDAALLLLKARPEYEATLVKRERVRGDLAAEADVINIKFRRQPTAIYARYSGGADAGREILYDDVNNPGKIAVCEPALLGDITIHLDWDSTLTKRSTNHNIKELGLEFPLTMMKRELATMQAHGLSPDLASGRLVTERGRKEWEILVKTPGPPTYYSAWTRLRFDVATAVVVEMEVRNAGGELLEHFRYRDIKWVKHPAATFDEENPSYGF